MSPDVVERMNELCKLIETEKNHKRFSQLIAKLNELLESKNNRLDHLSAAAHRPKTIVGNGRFLHSAPSLRFLIEAVSLCQQASHFREQVSPRVRLSGILEFCHDLLKVTLQFLKIFGRHRFGRLPRTIWFDTIQCFGYSRS